MVAMVHVITATARISARTCTLAFNVLIGCHPTFTVSQGPTLISHFLQKTLSLHSQISFLFMILPRNGFFSNGYMGRAICFCLYDLTTEILFQYGDMGMTCLLTAPLTFLYFLTISRRNGFSKKALLACYLRSSGIFQTLYHRNIL